MPGRPKHAVPAPRGQRPAGEVPAECAGDGTGRDLNEAPYGDSDSDRYPSALGSLAGHLALVVRELGALPPGAAAHVIARAAAEHHGPGPGERRR
ncbi:hypothetical protein [Kitasatospora sp. NPDC059327]|uniref:hypothetical protein n=1 Tax=Kitasatospora sp. NPDC059327 TaxID=3346803 RepID=UPI0036A616D7